MASNYTRWYRAGKVSLTSGSKIVTGTDTFFLTAGLHAGDLFTANEGNTFYEIDTIDSATQLTLKTNYLGATDGSSSYAIVRNFTASMAANVAANTAELLGDFRRYIDLDMQTLNGKSAYDIAVSHGYTGTESAWLESLIGGGQWDVLNARTHYMIENPRANTNSYIAGVRNTQVRGKCLGTAVTDAQLRAIRNGTFDDMYLGDFWYFPEKQNTSWDIKHQIVGFSHYHRTDGSGSNVINHIVVQPNYGIMLQLPEEARMNMNSENEPGAPYIRSNYYLNIRPYVIEYLKSFWGDNLMTWNSIEPSALDANGAPTAWTTATMQAELPLPEEMTGYAWYDHKFGVVMPGYIENGQFPLWRLYQLHARGGQDASGYDSTGTWRGAGTNSTQYGWNFMNSYLATETRRVHSIGSNGYANYLGMRMGASSYEYLTGDKWPKIRPVYCIA